MGVRTLGQRWMDAGGGPVAGMLFASGTAPSERWRCIMPVGADGTGAVWVSEDGDIYADVVAPAALVLAMVAGPDFDDDATCGVAFADLRRAAGYPDIFGLHYHADADSGADDGWCVEILDSHYHGTRGQAIVSAREAVARWPAPASASAAPTATHAKAAA